jgi:large subunit ribosomal protein L10
MSKVIKKMQISAIESRLDGAQELLVVDVSKVDAVSANKMRLALQEKQIGALTVKNALARKALNNIGVSALDEVLAGPSTLVWGGEDIVALSKEIAKWAKELPEFEIKGGTVEGQTLDAQAVDVLSKSPSREELIGKIAGMVLGPGARLAAALLGPGGYLAGQVAAIAEKDE